MQIPLALLAIFVLVDGFTGRQLAPRNVATTAVWLHYRGLVVIAIAVLGNAFCAACPIMLVRRPSAWLSRRLGGPYRWPTWARSKVLVTVLLLAVFWSYEAFDLWASPWLTAWLVVAYVAGALAVDALFPAGTFCRYVCPLGSFNFAMATVSPTQIVARDPDVCRSCRDKPCLHGRVTFDRDELARPLHAAGLAFVPSSNVVHPNGNGVFPGCESKLFVPTMTSNADCTACMNCVRACPFDNVALALRSPAFEASRRPWWTRFGPSMQVMGVLLLFWGFLNAAAMVPPFFAAAEWASAVLGTRNEGVLLAVAFLVTGAAGVLLVTIAGVCADLLGGARSTPWESFRRWSHPMVVLAFGFWAAHYLFHFATGATSIVPVFEHFFEYRGFPVDTNWAIARLVPFRWIFPITATVSVAYALVAGVATFSLARRTFGRRGVVAMWPVLALIACLVTAQLVVLGLPMEMRGTLLGPSF